METEERRRNLDLVKTSKKGRKCIKVRTTEEEERRREELKERLREKLELERRALQVVERLLEDSVSEEFLIDCTKFITPGNYRDAVEERFIAKLCGYPICPNKLGKIPTQQYKISTKTNRVYDISERKCFCSNICYKASKELELQISKTPLWLRQHESPPEIKLLKKGDCGSSGEEVILSERHLRQEDIENPQAAPSRDSHGSDSVGDGQSDCSDNEQEPEFISSVVSLQGRPRVHWGATHELTDQDENQKERIKKTEYNQVENKCEKNLKEVEENNGNDLLGEQEEKTAHVECLEEVTSKTASCTLSALLDTTDQNNQSRGPSNQAGPSITEVGMSRRGAAVLKNLLKKAQPDSLRHSLLECLKRTLKEWWTDETLKFLYGSEHAASLPSADEQEEDLDEDDLADDGTQPEGGGQRTPSAGAPEYERLRKETEQLQLRVREFYGEPRVLPEDQKELNGSQGVFVSDPALPPIDSRAQHLIQKRVTVEKLSSCLRIIVGSLGLTMNDISTDLNNLVRTFRFTNKNIIHRTPEWTLIAVVLLHVLSEVSPLVQEALETSASAQYLNTLMEELSLQDQDLLDLVQIFKRPTH